MVWVGRWVVECDFVRGCWGWVHRGYGVVCSCACGVAE